MASISIITINYNNAKGLQRTFESIKSQIDKVDEFIVIDGGSNDESIGLIEQNKSIISYFIIEKDTGVYHAMNKGIKKATKEYLFFLNSGDVFYRKNTLYKIKEYVTEYDLVCFNINLYGKDFNVIHKNPNQLSFYFLFSETLSHQSVFIKRELFNSYGLYDESLEIVSDWKFFLKAAMDGCTYKNYDITISKFEFGGLSSTLEGTKKRIKERKQVLSKEYPFYYKDFVQIENEKKLLKLNRFKMLSVIEKHTYGRILFSLLLKAYLFFHPKEKLKKII